MQGYKSNFIIPTTSLQAFSDRHLGLFALALFSWTLPLPVLGQYQNPSIMYLMNGFDLASIQTFDRHQLAYGNSDC